MWLFCKALGGFYFKRGISKNHKKLFLILLQSCNSSYFHDKSSCGEVGLIYGRRSS